MCNWCKYSGGRYSEEIINQVQASTTKYNRAPKILISSPLGVRIPWDCSSHSRLWLWVSKQNPLMPVPHREVLPAFELLYKLYRMQTDFARELLATPQGLSWSNPVWRWRCHIPDAYPDEDSKFSFLHFKIFSGCKYYTLQDIMRIQLNLKKITLPSIYEPGWHSAVFPLLCFYASVLGDVSPLLSWLKVYSSHHLLAGHLNSPQVSRFPIS